SGSRLDDGFSPAATALLLELGTNGHVIGELTATQRPDGSWNGSVHHTALVLEALRKLQVPNLVVPADGLLLSASNATDGEIVLASITVRNAGAGAAPPATITIFDSGGRPMGSVQTGPLLPQFSQTLTVQLDTAGHAGSTQAFGVVDPDGLVDE